VLPGTRDEFADSIHCYSDPSMDSRAESPCGFPIDGVGPAADPAVKTHYQAWSNVAISASREASPWAMRYPIRDSGLAGDLLTYFDHRAGRRSGHVLHRPP